MALPNQIRDDYTEIHDEDINSSISGNVFDNDGKLVNGPGPHEVFHVVAGTLESGWAGAYDGNGQFGVLTLDKDGNYTYTLTSDMNYLGEGVDVTETFTYDEEWYNNAGVLQTTQKTIVITIHGENDQPLISDVTIGVSEPEGLLGVQTVFDSALTAADDALKLEDIDPTTPGVQTDVDVGDTNHFEIVVGSVQTTSSDVDPALLTGINVTVNANGEYSLVGDFDALSVGDNATVTFQYQAVSFSAAGVFTPSDPKTVTINISGSNDALVVNNDTIVTYDQLLDGNIYNSILANDYQVDALNDPITDVNDGKTIVSTGYHDLKFWQEGGDISVQNASETLAYTPGGGGAIEKDHFSFYYQATDSYTDPIGSAVASFEMVNRGDMNNWWGPNLFTPGDVDFYQFGGNGDDTINGIEGKSNVLSGMGGDDFIQGKDGHDILYGGDGQDNLHGGWGNDIYKGGKGNDGFVDTRGNDLYVFSKGDGRGTIDDMNLEIYTDAMGHDDIANAWDPVTGMNEYLENEDTVHFDASVNRDDIAIFQSDNQFGSLMMKYSDNADDKVSVGYQQEDHYGIEVISHTDATGNTTTIQNDWWANNDGNALNSIDELVAYIASYDIDGTTAGVQTAQNVQQVQNDTHLMSVINAAWA